MPVQITINGENANQAIEEFATLSAAFAGQTVSPVSAAGASTAQLSGATTLNVPPAAPTTYQPQPTQQPTQQPQQGYGAPSVPVAPTPPVGTVPTSAPTYDLTQLGVAAQPVMDAGRQGEIIAWLNQHGVQTLMQLSPSLYGEFATFLRSLGAKI
ncbi:hypothetical protein M3201_18500 [Paenibacillus motobuensis]|uniref:hypothetical protein n=1 Tax=Paenibacillus TaxID=44249 RepID=UPI00203F8E9D|nr:MULTISPECIES: hypothetical protein [Paenibacillus]MCM3041688.1 hypothetical protein [Paenibacillus lutimineralis]MCM3648792.1 hypothetical protein [Paenibacillus motobuensis]